jgi:hypothetical protein
MRCIVYARFVIPDTWSATQETVISAASQAAAERHAIAVQTIDCQNEYSSIRTIKKIIDGMLRRAKQSKETVLSWSN